VTAAARHIPCRSHSSSSPHRTRSRWKELSAARAQLDRFLFKLTVPYPTEEELLRIAQLTTGVNMPHPTHVATGAGLLELMHFAREVPVAEPVMRYAVRIVRRTNPETPDAPAEVKRFARYGSSPRGLQSLVLGAKVRALLEGRYNVAFDDIRAVSLASCATASSSLRSRRRGRHHGQAHSRRRRDDVRGIGVAQQQTLLDANLAKRLERLTLVCRKRLIAHGQGDRRSLRKGFEPGVRRFPPLRRGRRSGPRRLEYL